jgi:hypothetical protein
VLMFGVGGKRAGSKIERIQNSALDANVNIEVESKRRAALAAVVRLTDHSARNRWNRIT